MDIRTPACAPVHTPAGIGRLLRSKTFAIANEDDLQRGIDETLTGVGLVTRREIRLTPSDRIDFLVPLIDLVLGIEVKVKGDAAGVHRQLARYAASPRVGELILATTMRRHRVGLPDTINGKTIHYVLLQVA